MEGLFFFLGLILGLLGGLGGYIEMSEGNKKTDENLTFLLNIYEPNGSFYDVIDCANRKQAIAEMKAWRKCGFKASLTIIHKLDEHVVLQENNKEDSPNE